MRQKWAKIGQSGNQTIYFLIILFMQQLTIAPLAMASFITYDSVKYGLTIITIGLQVIFAWVIFKQVRKPLIERRVLNNQQLIGVIVVAIIGILIIQLGTTWLQQHQILTNNLNEERLQRIADHNYLGFVIFTVVLGPITEELVFRGWLFQKWLAIWGPGIISKVSIVLISAIIFAVMHNPGAGINLVPYMLAGLLGGACYMMTGYIYVPIGIHVMLNIIGLW